MCKTKALLVVSFGTSFPETREKTIGAIEDDLAAAFPDRRFYRAWTSGVIRRKLKSATGETIDSVAEALARMAAGGMRDVLVQPTHMIAGEEYEKLCQELMQDKAMFSSVAVGTPLMAEEEDVAAVAKLLPALCPQVGREDMAVWMGHGSGALRMPVYEMLNEQLQNSGFDNHAVGTVEFAPGFEDVLRRVKKRRPHRVVLSPLMVVAGDHAVNDMAGDGPDSWKSRLRAEGVDVACVLKGLGEYAAVRALYTVRAGKARVL